MTPEQLYDELLSLAKRHFAEDDDDDYEDDQQYVFALLVDAVSAYAGRWERDDVERAQRPAEREAQNLPPEPRALADLMARPRWDLTLEAIADNIEAR